MNKIVSQHENCKTDPSGSKPVRNRPSKFALGDFLACMPEKKSYSFGNRIARGGNGNVSFIEEKTDPGASRRRLGNLRRCIYSEHFDDSRDHSFSQARISPLQRDGELAAVEKKTRDDRGGMAQRVGRIAGTLHRG